eukprot:1786879-Lingulodinium_polyedra.AAC.1
MGPCFAMHKPRRPAIRRWTARGLRRGSGHPPQQLVPGPGEQLPRPPRQGPAQGQAEEQPGPPRAVELHLPQGGRASPLVHVHRGRRRLPVEQPAGEGSQDGSRSR